MAKARARQLPLTKAMDAEARKQNMLVGNQKDRGKPNWPLAREPQGPGPRRSAAKKTQAVLKQIRKRYGDAELQRAIREFNITFNGIQRDPKKERTPHTADLWLSFAHVAECPSIPAAMNRRLCDTCGWFGDNAETAKRRRTQATSIPCWPPSRPLRLFRDVCRQELVAEQIYDAGNATEADLRKVKTEARNCPALLVELFTALRRPHAPPPIVLKHINGLGAVAGPVDRPPLQRLQ